MEEILFICYIFFVNLIWFVFYLCYVEKLPFVKIMIFSFMSLIIFAYHDSFFLQNIIDKIFGAILLGGGITGFIEYVKNLYRNFRKDRLSFRSILIILLYVGMCFICIGLRQN